MTQLGIKPQALHVKSSAATVRKQPLPLNNIKCYKFTSFSYFFRWNRTELYTKPKLWLTSRLNLFLFYIFSCFILNLLYQRKIGKQLWLPVIGFWNSLTFPRKNVLLISDQINWIDIFTNKSPKRKVSSFVIIKRTEKRWITSHFPNISFSSDFSPRFKFPWLKAKSPDIQLTSTGLALIIKKFIFLRQFPDLQQPWQWNTAIISSFFDQVPS